MFHLYLFMLSISFDICQGGQVHDVTQLCLEQKSLRKDALKIQFGLEDFRLHYWSYDVQSQQVSWGTDLLRLLGGSEDSFRNIDDAFALVHEEDAPVVRELFARCVEQGIPYSVDMRMWFAALQKTVWVNSRAHAHLDHLGRVQKVTGLITNVTERKVHIL